MAPTRLQSWIVRCDSSGAAAEWIESRIETAGPGDLRGRHDRFIAGSGRAEWFISETGLEVSATLALAAIALVSPAHAATEITWWHAMSGELGKQVEKLAADFNASQSDYRIVPTYKGNYTETVTAAIFAFRSRSQPAIVQVNEIATATMMAAQGRDLSGVRADARPDGAVLARRPICRPSPAITPTSPATCCRFRSTPRRRSSITTRICSAPRASIPKCAPKTWPEVGAAAKRLRAAGAVCGFTTSWPSWINVENFSAFHNLPLATRANGFGGLDAELDLQQSAGGAPHRATGGMADDQDVRL